MQARQAVEAGTARCTCDVCRVDTGAIRTTAHDDGTPYGVLGTTQWGRDDAARRDAAYGIVGVVQGWHVFATPRGTMGAPEYATQRTVDGTAYAADSNGTPTIATRRYIARARRYGVARRQRLATLALARRRASAALNAARAAHGTPRVVEWTLIPRYPRPLDRYAALDEWSTNRDAERRAWVDLTTHAASGEGRGTVDHAPNSVNGTETRVAPRWHGTPRVAVMSTVETRNGVACVAPVDWRCYRVAADGTRTALVTTATAKRRKRTASRKVDHAATLRGIAGTLGVDAQG